MTAAAAPLRALARRVIAGALLPAARLGTRWRPGIRILMYHRVDRLPGFDQLTVTPERFARQLEHLARHHRVLALGEAVAELRAGGAVRPGVVVTFDDGYLDNLVHALPLLRTHRIPAAIFVTAAFCDQARRHPRYPGGGRLHLHWDELRALASDPLVTVGSHTLTHPHLSRLGDAAAWDEIAASRERIARELGRPVEFLCYPSGDAGAREHALARAAGYRAALSVAPGVNRPGAPAFALRRTEVTDRDAPADLEAKLAGAYDLPHRWLHRVRTRRFEAAAGAARREGERG